MMEISTPFVSIRGILSTFGMKESKAYVINGIFMMVTFFLCRIVMWPYLFYWYSQIANITFIQASESIISLNFQLPYRIVCKLSTFYFFFVSLSKSHRRWFHCPDHAKSERWFCFCHKCIGFTWLCVAHWRWWYIVMQEKQWKQIAY